MLKSCRWCYGIHDHKYECPKKPKRKKYNLSDADKFRKTTQWIKKSIEIRQRDKGLCQVCIRKLYNTQQQYSYNTLEVHHIIPLVIDTNMTYALDNEWLISLCKYHHYMADAGEIPQEELHLIAKEQELNKL